MCCWLVYLGNFIQMEIVLFWLWYLLIDQSLCFCLGGEMIINGDGFGIGWYGCYFEVFFCYCCLYFVWNDINLCEVVCVIWFLMFIVYVCVVIDILVQEINCYLFCYGWWFFVYNGLICEYLLFCCVLMMEVVLELFCWIEGLIDFEIMFFLVFLFGLDCDLCGVLEQMVGLIEDIGWCYGVEYFLNMMVCVMDGVQIVVVCYFSEGELCFFFYSIFFKYLYQFYFDSVVIEDVGDGVFFVLFELFVDLFGVWVEIFEEMVVIVKGGVVEYYCFVLCKFGFMGFDFFVN